MHPVTGEVFLSEMGPNGGDEINRIKAGRNYGWPLVSFGRTYTGPWQNDGNVSTHAGFEEPILYWMPSISVTGLSFYQGNALPKWKATCSWPACATARSRAPAAWIASC